MPDQKKTMHPHKVEQYGLCCHIIFVAPRPPAPSFDDEEYVPTDGSPRRYHRQIFQRTFKNPQEREKPRAPHDKNVGTPIL